MGDNSSIVSAVTNPTFATSTREDSNKAAFRPTTAPPKKQQKQNQQQQQQNQGASSTPLVVDSCDYSAFRACVPFASSSPSPPRIAVAGQQQQQDEFTNPFFSPPTTTASKDQTRRETMAEAPTSTASSPAGADENADPPDDSLYGGSKLMMDSSTTCAIKKEVVLTNHHRGGDEEKKDDYGYDPAASDDEEQAAAAAVAFTRSGGRGPPAPCPPPPPPPPMRSTTVNNSNNNKNSSTANMNSNTNSTRRLSTKTPRAFIAVSPQKSPTNQRQQQQQQRTLESPASSRTSTNNSKPFNLNHPLVSGSRSPAVSSTSRSRPRRWSSPISSSSRLQEPATPPPPPPSLPFESPGSRSQMHDIQDRAPVSSRDRLPSKDRQPQEQPSYATNTKSSSVRTTLLGKEKMTYKNVNNNIRRENFTESPLKRAHEQKTQQRLKQVQQSPSPDIKHRDLALSPTKRSSLQHHSPPPATSRRSVLAIAAITGSGSSGGAVGASSHQGETTASSNPLAVSKMNKQQKLQQMRSRALSQSPARQSRAMIRSPTKLRPATTDAGRRTSYRGTSSSPIKRRGKERDASLMWDVSLMLMKSSPSSAVRAQVPHPARVGVRQQLGERPEKGLINATPPRGRWESPLKPQKQQAHAPPSLERQDPIVLNRLRAMSPTTEVQQASSTTTGLSNPPVASAYPRPPPFGPRSSSPLRQPFVGTKVGDQGEKINTSPQAVTPHMVAKLRDRQLRKDANRYGVDVHPTSSDEAVGARQNDKKKKEHQSASTPSSAVVRSKSPATKMPLPPRAVADQNRQKSVSRSQVYKNPDYVTETLDVHPTSSDDDAQTFNTSCTNNSLSSVGSDIRRLRSILRRSRGNSHEVTRESDADRGYRESLQSAFAVYTEGNVDDPMHRAGLRLLSAAVIPIQTATRRFLSLRAALTRMWAIVVIQAFARRWLLQSSFLQHCKAAVSIQSVYRGVYLRYQMTVERCCAIEIQRFVRGYMATLRVYEKIYKITLVQSLARRKRAIDQATDRMVFIIQLQATARGFLWRSKLQLYTAAATWLQAFWRGSSARMSFQLDILDILIAQSVARRNIARAKVDTLRSNRHRLAAIKIQSQWRCYDLNLVYREFRAARKIQTQWRRYDVSNMYREYMGARKIQAAWRRFKAKKQFRLDLFSIIAIETRWRARSARRVVRQRLALRRYRAATSIQSAWRRCEMKTKYHVLLLSTLILQCLWRATSARHYVGELREMRRHAMATMIQAAWRGYDIADAYRRYRSARTIQRIWRGYDVVIAFERYKAARIFQTLWRRFDTEMRYKLDLFSIVTVQGVWRKKTARRKVAALLEGRRYVAAREIQARWRGHCVAVIYRRYTAARMIQKIWRGYDIADAFRRYRASKTIQTAWRRYDILLAYTRFKAARTIQTAWRGYDLTVKYTLDVFSIVTVQTLWRAKSAIRRARMLQDARIYVAARTIQSRWRGYDVAVEYRRYKAAQTIQSAWRGYHVGMIYLRFMAARIIQAEWRAFAQSVRFKLDLFSVIMIQTLWRSKAAYIEVEEKKELRRYLSARSIQSCWRGHTLAVAYVRYLAARRIQALWRGASATIQFKTSLFAVTAVQAAWRAKVSREYVEHFRHCRREKAATAIQSTWRGHVVFTTYAEYIAARKIQKMWRGYDKSVLYQLELFSVVTVQALWRGRSARQLAHQMSDQRSRSAATKIQSIWRGFVLFSAYYRYVAARKIQAIWRGYDIFTAYRRYRAATIIQATWRGYDVSTAYRRYCSARAIQARWRAHAQSIRYELDLVSIITVQSAWRGRQATLCMRRLRDCRMNSSATAIQTSWRGFLTALLYKRFLATRSIQAAWRCYSNRTAYQDYLAAQKIQAAWRGYDKSAQYKRFLATRSIQTAWRCYSNRTAYQDYLAAQKIQAAWRGYDKSIQYKRFLATRSIQAAWRCYSNRTAYQDYLAARKMQAAWRGYDKSIQYQLDLLSVITVQTVWRRKSACRVVHQLCERRRDDAATIIQALWRGYDMAIAYRRYLMARRIQSIWRRHCSIVSYRRNKAARKIQAIWRGYDKAVQYQLDLLCIITVQTVWRAKAAMVAANELRQERRCASAISIQAAWRGYDTATLYRRFISARRIQALWRGYNIAMAYRRYLAARRIQALWRGSVSSATYRRYICARTIQSAWRRYDLSSSYEAYIGARKIQSAWRRHTWSSQYHIALVNVISIQSLWRATTARVIVAELRDRRQNDRFISARKIQAAWRGYDMALAYRRYRAAQTLQAVWRGYDKAVQYQLDLYSILAVQSFWRARCARCYVRQLRDDEHAQREIISATTIQASWRRTSQVVQYRKHLSCVLSIQTLWLRAIRRTAAATKIQAAWRGYNQGVEYQLDIYKIVLVQSNWRRKVALGVAGRLRTLRRLAAATIIQARWRSYDCSSNYSQYLVDVATAQGIVRAWLSRRAAERLRILSATAVQTIFRGRRARNQRRRRKAAVVLQRSWRGFSCYSDYMFTVADIVVVQSLARRLFAKRAYFRRHNERRASAAIAIQRIWRGFVSESDYYVMKYERRAATIVQSAWRGFWQFSNFIIALDSAIRIQTITRGYMAFQKYEEKLGAALVIQNAVRFCRARLDATNASTLRSLLRTADSLARKERSAATLIQRVLRGGWCRQSITLYMKARLIQAVWRGRGPCIEYKRHCAARIVQAKWRGYWLRCAYKYYRAARSIQTQWRGFWLRHAFKFFLAARRIQTTWRCKAISYSYKVYISARRIQAFWRCKATASAYRGYISARKIQVFWRAKHALRTYTAYIAARRIQTFWRGKDAERAYIEYISTRRIQNAWRSKMARNVYAILRQKLKEYCAILLMQSLFRRKIARLYFIDLRSYLMVYEIRAATRIQQVWRGYFIRWVGFRFVRWLKIRDDREHGAVVIQSNWRRHHAMEKYWHVLGSAIQIQAITRGFMARTTFLEQRGAACMLQCFVRVAMAKEELARRHFIVSLVKSAKSASKGFKRKVTKHRESGKNWETVVNEQKKIDLAARTIQRFFAMVKREVDREVRAEKKRRRRRKMKKADVHGQDVVDDDLLENVWEKTMKTPPDIRPAVIVRAVPSISRKGSMNSRAHSPPALPGRGSMSSLPTNGVEVSITGRPLQNDSSRPPSRPREERTSSRSRSLVHSNSNTERAKTKIRQARDDDTARSEASDSSVGYYQHLLTTTPPSRMALSRHEVEVDFELETAFLDAQIHSAKEATRDRSTDQRHVVAKTIVKRRDHSQQQQQQQLLRDPRPRASSAQRPHRAASQPRHTRTASEGGSGRINIPQQPHQQQQQRAFSSTRTTRSMHDEEDIYYYHYGDGPQQQQQYQRRHQDQQQHKLQHRDRDHPQQQQLHYEHQKPRSIPASRSSSIAKSGSSASRR
jgi:IQ calmodulin-binding motif